MRSYVIGSQESLELLSALIRFKVNEIFKTKTVTNFLEFHFEQVKWVGIA